MSTTTKTTTGNYSVTIEHVSPGNVLAKTADGDMPFRIEDATAHVECEALGAWLGYARPRKARERAVELHRDGFINDSEFRPVSGQNTGERGRPVREIWLTRSGALKLAARSDTPKAAALLDMMVRVFEAVLDRRPVAVRALPADVKKIERERDDAIKAAIIAREQLARETRLRLDVEMQLRSGGVLGPYRARATCDALWEIARINEPDRGSAACRAERTHVEKMVRRRIEYRGAFRTMSVTLERALTMALDAERLAARERAAASNKQRQITIFDALRQQRAS